MNTSVHIPKELAKRLEKYLASNHCPDKSKNAFIVEAIAQRLEQLENDTNWSQEILEWQGGDIPLEREELTGFAQELNL